LHGVTSGKTEILHKINRRVLSIERYYTTPEIALTTQLIVGRLVVLFYSKVVVFHSKYTAERVEVWNQVVANSEKLRFVIERSALFFTFCKFRLHYRR
jgi:primosomal protein N' (replication factor Y)